jgi:hypothetical protein
MKQFPVDQARLSFILVDLVPVVDRDTGEQRSDRDGVPAWRANALTTMEGEPGGEVISVRINAPKCPDLSPLSAVEFDSLTARGWEMDGRSGISLSASGVRPAGSAQNGSKGPRAAAETVGALS